MIERLRPWSVHVDISPRSAVDEAEKLMHNLVVQHDIARFGSAPVVLRQVARLNHFEIVGCQRADISYDEYASSPAMVALRRSLASLLASPFVVCLYEDLSVEQWPTIHSDDLVMFTQFELVENSIDVGFRRVDEYVALQGSVSGLVRQVTLKRLGRTGVFDLVSVWSALELVDTFLATAELQRLRGGLSEVRAAPIEDRRHDVVVGGLSEL